MSIAKRQTEVHRDCSREFDTNAKVCEARLAKITLPLLLDDEAVDDALMALGLPTSEKRPRRAQIAGWRSRQPYSRTSRVPVIVSYRPPSGLLWAIQPTAMPKASATPATVAIVEINCTANLRFS